MKISGFNSPNNFSVYHIAVLTMVIMLHITSPVLIYLVTGFWPLPFNSTSPNAVSGDYKSELFFCEFVCLCLDCIYNWDHTIFIYSGIFYATLLGEEHKFLFMVLTTKWYL